MAHAGEARKKEFAYRRQIVELWNMEAVKTLAKMHRHGLGKADVNMEKAVKWYRRAAEAGDFESAKELGIIYDRGRGVEVDKTQAVQWYERALQAGDEEIRREDEEELLCISGTRQDKKQKMIMIMVRLSDMYEHGIGAAVDEERAAELRKRAKEEKTALIIYQKKASGTFGDMILAWFQAGKQRIESVIYGRKTEK